MLTAFIGNYIMGVSGNHYTAYAVYINELRLATRERPLCVKGAVA